MWLHVLMSGVKLRRAEGRAGTFSVLLTIARPKPEVKRVSILSRDRIEVPMKGNLPLAYYPSTGCVKWVKPSGLEADSGLRLPMPEQDFAPENAEGLYREFAKFFAGLADKAGAA